jgi:hypothetical protein
MRPILSVLKVVDRSMANLLALSRRLGAISSASILLEISSRMYRSADLFSTVIVLKPH